MRPEPPVSITATQRCPMMNPILAISSCPGASRASCCPRCTNTPGASSRTVKALAAVAAGSLASPTLLVSQIRPRINARRTGCRIARSGISTRAASSRRRAAGGALSHGAAPAGIEMRVFRVDDVEQDRRGQRLVRGNAERWILAQRDAGIGLEQWAALAAEADLRDVMRRDRLAAARIDLKSGIVRVADADQHRLAVGRSPESDLTEPAGGRGARRRRAAATGVDPGAAHLEFALGGLGDRTHRGESIDAHAQADLGHAGASGDIEGRGHGRWIVIDDHADLLDVPDGRLAETQRQGRRRRIRSVRRRLQAHVILVKQAELVAGVELLLQIFPGAACRTLPIAERK